MKEISQFYVRLPLDLKEWIKERASSNNRSMNGEIIDIMKNIREKERPTKKNK